ncbi:formaldehyde-activating enzyme [Streptomyces sp. NPDC085932]|uniref:formaldehyde-activating enzyme n=1 Tax=Streptomyces sp. NPDC085932 TaxID=3365741 RepID=UPI0037D6D8A4
MNVGEARLGESPNDAHVTTITGCRPGCVRPPRTAAFTTPFSPPRPGATAVPPDITPPPVIVFLGAGPLTSRRHRDMTLGPAQAGVAAGVTDAVLRQEIPRHDAGSLVIVVLTGVNPAATDPEQVYLNHRGAVRRALMHGATGPAPGGGAAPQARRTPLTDPLTPAPAGATWPAPWDGMHGPAGRTGHDRRPGHPFPIR